MGGMMVALFSPSRYQSILDFFAKTSFAHDAVPIGTKWCGMVLAPCCLKPRRPGLSFSARTKHRMQP